MSLCQAIAAAAAAHTAAHSLVFPPRPAFQQSLRAGEPALFVLAALSHSGMLANPLNVRGSRGHHLLLFLPKNMVVGQLRLKWRRGAVVRK
ncbi:hypothetical protein E2C01_056792 [Portunus trituberculatus]|uniref:Uncharacterized protein n=1 Tax=Portunus trituberculatus TaxID=210409 RepID=A0A5B7GYD7_PORTR|nr:hypothetical protein [Portunus trituberculatus]